MMKLSKISILATCCILFFSTCRKEPEDLTVRINKEEFSVKDLKMIGTAFYDGIAANDEITILDKEAYPEAHGYLDVIYGMLINTDMLKNRQNFDWNISIIHDDHIKTAFAVPGGHMFIYTGMLKHVKSEAELSCVLAHELFYTDNLNGVERLKAEYGGQLLGDIVLGNAISDLGGMAINVANLMYSSEEVLDADAFALDIICQFNYDAKALKRILDNSSEDITWLQTRAVSDMEDRKNKLLRNSSDCHSSSTFATRYGKFVREMLP